MYMIIYIFKNSNYLDKDIYFNYDLACLDFSNLITNKEDLKDFFDYEKIILFDFFKLKVMEVIRL